MRKLIIALASFIASMIGANTVCAAQIIQTQIVSGYTCQLCGFTATFDQFDPAQGTLVGMRVSISGEQFFSASIYPAPGCEDDCDPTGYYGFSVGYTLNGPGFPHLDPGAGQFFALINQSGPVSYFDQPPPLPNTFDYTTSTDDLNPYIGTGIVLFEIGESEDSDFCATDGEALCFLQSSVQMAVTLTYFTAPEPATIGMLGGGLIALVGARRKSLARKREVVSTRWGE